MIEFYTMKGCSACDHVKSILSGLRIEYTEIQVGIDLSLAEFRRIYPDCKMFPLLVKDGKVSDVNKIIEGSD